MFAVKDLKISLLIALLALGMEDQQNEEGPEMVYKLLALLLALENDCKDDDK